MAEVATWKKSNRLVLRKRRYTLRPNFSLHYTVDPAIMNFEVEEQEEDSWDDENWESFWTDRIEPSLEYRSFLQLAKPQSEQPNLVRWFASKVAYDVALGVERPRVDENVEIITRDLTGGEQDDYKVTIWLDGIRPTNDEVVVSDSLIIRKPTRADLQERVLDRHAHYWHALHRSTNFSCIAELRVRTHRVGDVQRVIDRHITALRLFRLGSVSTSRYHVSSESFSTMSNFAINGREQYGRVAYQVSSGDAPLLSRFLETVIPAIPSDYEYAPKETLIKLSAFHSRSS